MKSLKLASLFLLLIIIVISCKSPNEPEKIRSGDLDVTVQYTGYYSSTGTVKNAKVYIKATDFKSATDDYGRVLFRGVPEGVYEVYSFLEGTGSGKETIQIESNTLNKLTINLKYGILYEPKIIRTSPNPNSYYPTYKSAIEDTIKFVYTVTDNITSSEKIYIEMTSDLDGKLFQGYPRKDGKFEYRTASLSKGTHTIKITAKDEEGYVGKDSLTVVNTKSPRSVLNSSVESSGDITLNWEKCIDPDFTKYELYRATNREWNWSYNSHLVYSSENNSNINYSDKEVPIADSVFYKLVIYNKRADTTETVVKITNPYGQLINYSLSTAVIHPTEPFIYLVTADYSYKKLIKYNYVSRKIIQTIDLPNYYSAISIGENGQGVELYIGDLEGKVTIYDPETLTSKYIVFCKNSIKSIVTDGNGHIYVSVYSGYSEKTVKSYDRYTGQSLDMNGSGYESGIIRITPDKKKLIQILESSGHIGYFKLNDNGTIDEFIEKNPSQYINTSDRNFKISPSGEYFVTTYSGYIFTADESIKFLGKLNTNSNSFSDCDISSDSKFICTISSKSILTFSYPDLGYVKSISTKTQAQKIFILGTKIISFGSDSYNSKFIVEVNNL